MRLATALIAAIAIGWSACSLGEPARPVAIELGKDFSLRVGASARSSDAALQIGVEAVTGDSRCPKGEQCVRAGDATVRVWVQAGSGPKQTRDLISAPGAGQPLRLKDHELRLVRLEPYPIAGKPIAKADYVATFTLSPASGTDPER